MKTSQEVADKIRKSRRELMRRNALSGVEFLRAGLLRRAAICFGRAKDFRELSLKW